MMLCEVCKGQRVVHADDGWHICPICKGEGMVPDTGPKPEPTPDSNVAFHPTGEYTPLAVATKVLARSKEKDVISLVSYMTIATEHGVGILPFVSNIGLAEMSMIAATASAMTQNLLQQGVVTKPAGPDNAG